MQEIVLGIAATVLVVHGLIHLLGTAVYMKMGHVEGLPYKTTLLGGRWDLGESGIRWFGALWIVPAVGFVVAALALWSGWPWAPSLAIAVALLSLLLTTLDWSTAYAGALVDAVILGAVWLGPAVLSRLR